MSKPISSFFSPVGVKSSSKTSAKRAQADVDPAGDPASPTAKSPKGTPLSPEQQKQIAEKRLEAVLKQCKAKGLPLTDSLAPDWRQALRAEFDKPYYKQLMEFLTKQQAAKKVIYPPPEMVHSYSRACRLRDVKVVILGQDPYHGPGQAHGLCFSVLKGVAIPGSLRNIYKELTADIDGFVAPKHGYLQSWADQGVLMLNACLTVEHKQPNSHAGQGWEKYTDAVIAWISKNLNNVVFILWGNYAKKKGSKVDQKRHCVLAGAHPSPLSATKYFGCRHFSRANEYLKKHGKKPINWSSVSDA